nr:nucleotide exchange factor GrpE [Hyphomicrobiales bacterium]
TVAQVMQEGFTIGDRVLRAAMVGVAKGGPSAGPAAASAGESAAEVSPPSG